MCSHGVGEVVSPGLSLTGVGCFRRSGRSRCGSLSLGMVDEFFGMAGYHHPSEGQGHNLGDLFWCEDFSFSFGVLVGTPIVVRDLVVGRPEGRQVLHTV